MGILGVSKVEEQQLRQAAKDVRDRDAHSNVRHSISSDGQSMTGSSAYETAEEGEEEGDTEDEQSLREQQQQPEQPEQQDETGEATVIPDDHDDNITIQQFNFDSNKDSMDASGVNSPEGVSVHSYPGNNLSDMKSLAEKGQEPQSKGLTLSQLDWDDSLDKGNPLNWSHLKRWYITFTVALMCLCVSLGSSLFVSGVFELMAATGASQELCLSGLTFYLLGLSFGPALAAPISETYGRKIVYITSFPISMLFTMGIGLSDKIYQILILRFFCGLLASPALAVAGGTITDIWRPEERGIAMALFCLAPFLGPVLGPIVGGFAAEHKGWKWTMWVSLMFSGAILPFVLALPETYKPVLMVKRAKQRGLKLDLPSTSEVLKVTLSITLLRPMEMLVVEPIVLVWSFYIAFIFAVLFGFFEAFPIIFQGVYKMDLGVSGLTFVGVGIGLALGVVFYIVLDRLVFFPKNADGTRGKRDENGNLVGGQPEDILPVGKVGAICLPIALFWLGWTGRHSIHWAVPTASGIPFGFGLILIFFTNMLYFSTAFPPASVASALGANNFLRYLLASVFPLFTGQMYEKLDIGWATSIFAFISLALLPIPWIFQKIGPTFRKRSRFGYDAISKQHKSRREQEIEDDVVSAVSIMEGLSRANSRVSRVNSQPHSQAQSHQQKVSV